MGKEVIRMRLIKVTPGAAQYNTFEGEQKLNLNDERNAANGIYLRKAKVGDPPPTEITITVEW